MGTVKSMIARRKGERTGTAKRGLARIRGQALVDAAPMAMREALAQPDEIKAYVRILVADRDDRECSGHRTAMRLIPEILQAVGASQQIVSQLILAIGAPIEQARAAVEVVNAVPDDPHAIAQNCRAFLAWYDAQNWSNAEAV